MNLHIDIFTLLRLSGKDKSKAINIINSLNHSRMAETIYSLRDQAIILNAYAEADSNFVIEIKGNWFISYDVAYREYVKELDGGNSNSLEMVTIKNPASLTTDDIQSYNKEMTPYTMKSVYEAVTSNSDDFSFGSRHPEFEKLVLNHIKSNINSIVNYKYIYTPGECTVGKNKGKYGLYNKFPASNLSEHTVRMFKNIVEYARNTYCMLRDGSSSDRLITVIMKYLKSINFDKKDIKIFGYNFNSLKDNKNINTKLLYNNNYSRITDNSQYTFKYCEQLKEQCVSVLGKRKVSDKLEIDGLLKDMSTDDMFDRIRDAIKASDDTEDNLESEYSVVSNLFSKTVLNDDNELETNPEYNKFHSFIENCASAIYTMQNTNTASIKTLIKLYVLTNLSTAYDWNDVYNFNPSDPEVILSNDELLSVSSDLCKLGIIGCNIVSTDMLIDDINDNSYVTASNVDTTSVQDNIKEVAHRLARAVDSYSRRFNIMR